MEELGRINYLYQRNIGAHKQRLTAILTPASLCCLCTDSNNNLSLITSSQYQNSAQLETDFKEILDQRDISNIELLLLHHNFTLIPRKLFQWGKERSYLQPTHNITSSDVLYTDILSHESLVNIHFIENELDGFLRKQMSNTLIYHLNTRIIERSSFLENTLLLAIFENSISITIKGEGAILGTMVYEINKIEDIVYHLTGIKRYYKLKDINIKVFGLIYENDSVHSMLRKYFTNLNLMGTSLNENLMFLL